jgi:hypothetical protein
MKKTGIPTYWFALLTALGTVGCGAEGVENAGGPNQPVEQSEHALTWRTLHGSSAGTKVTTGENYLLGYQLRSGSWIDQLKIVGYYGYKAGPFGGGGGSDQGYHQCNTGDTIVGMYGYANASYVTQLGFICGVYSTGATYDLPAGGQPTGTPFRDVCPAKQSLDALQVYYGTYVNGIVAGCGVPIVIL